MKVVYAYRSYSDHCDLIDNPCESFIFKCSLLSWMKYAPNVQREIYCDSKVTDFLKKVHLFELLDQVHTVDFEQELDRRYGGREGFFAYPKMYAMMQQDSPFFLCDTDGVLLSPLIEWFNPSNYYTVHYDSASSSRTPVWTNEEGLRLLAKGCSGTPTLRSFCNHTNTINAGLLYFADPRVGQIVGHMILALNLDIETSLEQLSDLRQKGNEFLWTLYEESLLEGLITYISREKIEEIPAGRFRECSGTSTEDVDSWKALEEVVKNLNFDYFTREFHAFARQKNNTSFGSQALL